MNIGDLYVPGDLFSDLFEPVASGPSLPVNYAVWQKICQQVPDGYKLPDLPVATLTLPSGDGR
ncbi:hypothetical protein [Cohnella sp. JJ-181]|uniref:hypothetical protein n=1 Tax=Cohnella rhizoplanae TaxID=2974897 RepID=UPI0022FFBF2A|nr:hypothetical protein [Cohnella sp. JJ-181]CAI6032111.1 hypothetical protein COHCIP112018_00745 [Cohnella sp. JJ-181]